MSTASIRVLPIPDANTEKTFVLQARKIWRQIHLPEHRLTDWRCRSCWSLVYACQRYGNRHPLRKQLTHRKKMGLRKLILRQVRRNRFLARGSPTPAVIESKERLQQVCCDE